MHMVPVESSIAAFFKRPANRTNYYNLNSIVKKLAEINFVRNIEYGLFNMITGFYLAPQDKYVVFEMKTTHLPNLNSYNDDLFQGQLGDKYCREISAQILLTESVYFQFYQSALTKREILIL